MMHSKIVAYLAHVPMYLDDHWPGAKSAEIDGKPTDPHCIVIFFLSNAALDSQSRADHFLHTLFLLRADLGPAPSPRRHLSRSLHKPSGLD